MLGIPPDLARLYDTLLEQESVAVKYRPHYKKMAALLLGFLS